MVGTAKEGTKRLRGGSDGCSVNRSPDRKERWARAPGRGNEVGGRCRFELKLCLARAGRPRWQHDGLNRRRQCAGCVRRRVRLPAAGDRGRCSHPGAASACLNANSVTAVLAGRGQAPSAGPAREWSSHHSTGSRRRLPSVWSHHAECRSWRPERSSLDSSARWAPELFIRRTAPTALLREAFSLGRAFSGLEPVLPTSDWASNGAENPENGSDDDQDNADGP